MVKLSRYVFRKLGKNPQGVEVVAVAVGEVVAGVEAEAEAVAMVLRVSAQKQILKMIVPTMLKLLQEHQEQQEDQEDQEDEEDHVAVDALGKIPRNFGIMLLWKVWVIYKKKFSIWKIEIQTIAAMKFLFKIFSDLLNEIGTTFQCNLTDYQAEVAAVSSSTEQQSRKRSSSRKFFINVYITIL